MSALARPLLKTAAAMLAGLALALAALAPAQAEEAEEKVYEQGYREVKEAFDTTRDTFKKVYGPISEAQAAATNWRNAVTRAQQNLSTRQIEDLVAGGMGMARDEMVERLLGEDALAALKKLEEVTGKTFLLPEPKRMLDYIRDPDDFTNKFGHMYKISQLERAFRNSAVKDALDKANALFEKGEAYIGDAGKLIEFMSVFDPNNNSADGPIGRLKSVGAVLDYAKEFSEEIPGIGHLIGFYAEAARSFAGSLERLDAKVKEARSGALCGQLGYLVDELKALDAHIAGGDCNSFMTDYAAEATLRPLKVWEHFETGETFIWRDADKASAYLSGGNMAALLTAYRALAQSRSAENRGRANPDTFLSRAIVTTHAGRIFQYGECERAARMLASTAFAEVLHTVGLVSRTSPIVAGSGTRIWPGLTSRDEIIGLCLFDPAMSKLMKEIVAQFGNYGVFTLELVSADWKRPEAPRDPSVVVNGQELVDGERGTRVLPASARIYGLRALADLSVPLAVAIEAEGFLPKAVRLPLSRERAYAKIGLEPEPDEDAAAQAAAEAEAEEEARAIAAAQEAERKAQAEAEELARAVQEAEAEAEAIAGEIARVVAETIARIAAGDPPPPPTPLRVPPAPEPVEPGEGAGPADEAGDVNAPGAGLAPAASVEVGSAPGDTEPLGAPTGEEAATASGTDTAEGEAVADNAPSAVTGGGEAAPGMGTQVPLAGVPGQVWLGDRVVISTQWTDPAAAAADTGRDAAPAGSGASVTITTADDTEDIGPARPAPAPLTFIWQGSEGVRFDPPTSTDGRTVARFERPGRALVWAQILRDGTTVAEGTQQAIEVGVPSISLRFDPASGGQPGQEITAQTVMTPPLDEDLFRVVWRAPATTDRRELDGPGARIAFTGEANEVIPFEAEVVTPFWGDDIGTITGSYSFATGTIEVTAEARGPRPQIWDAAAGDLIDAPEGRWVTGQQIALSAAFMGEAPAAPRWEWRVNDGTTILNPIVQSPTVTRSEPGMIEAVVVARDAEGRELGRGAISLAVAADVLAMVAPDGPPDSRDMAEKVPEPGPPEQAEVNANAPGAEDGANGQPATAIAISPATRGDTVSGAPSPPPPFGCAPGSALEQEAARRWQSGLAAIASGRTGAGLADLDRSLALCPDAERAAQVTGLRERVAAVAPGAATVAPPPQAPCGGRLDEAADLWRSGLAAVSAGRIDAGLAALETSLALCPDEARAAQVAALRERLATAGTARPVPDGDHPPAPQIGLEAAADAARAACAPGGARHAEATAALASAEAALSARDHGGALAALRRAQGLCPQAQTAALIAEVEAALRLAEAQAEAAARAQASAVQPPRDPTPPVTAEPVWEPAGEPRKANIHSIMAVQNGPTRPSEFAVDQPSRVTALQTYHWNFGQGASPGTIGLVNDRGERFGPWPAEGRPGQGGVPNASWYAYPGEVIPPGRYRVIDSDPGTWATNAETGHRGIFQIDLQPVRDVSAAPVAAAPPPAVMVDGLYAGSIDGGSGIAIAFEVRGGRVEGTVRGLWDDDRVELAFSGDVAGAEFRVPISGTITDPYMSWPISGQIWGAIAGEALRGGWDLGASDDGDGGDRESGTWQAKRQ